MKKNLSILSVLFAFALSMTLVSCGAKKDEALVAEFSAKQTEANKVITDAEAQAKTMMEDHKTWSAKLDSVAKTPKADTMKVAAFKAEIKKMEDQHPAMMAMVDSLKSYANAKTDNNDQLKSAIAGLNAQLSAFTTSCNSMADQHKKLGADITAFLGGAPAPASAPVTSTTTTTKTVTKPAAGANEIPKTMDKTVHQAPTPAPTPRRKAAGTVKQ